MEALACAASYGLILNLRPALFKFLFPVTSYNRRELNNF